MSEYIDKNEAVDEGYLQDWYISSVSEDDEPVWTDAHIEELANDFIVIPKDTPAADVAPVVHAYWKGYHTQDPCCSNCGFSYDREQGEDAQTTDYCGNCGAKMDENEVENLKHCSCGDRHYCPEVEKDENGKWFIRCHMCHKIVRGNTIEEAVNAWNRRADTNDP